MIINLDNLRAGLDWQRENSWEKDILNALYYDIYSVRSSGVTLEWWTATVDRLIKWNAHRPNINRTEIAKRGEARLEAIADQYGRLAKSTTEPTITDVDWEDLAPFFEIASEIKPVKNGSPVFPSKMCHFLFPKLFIPMDNTATGIADHYGKWWQDMKAEWIGYKDKEEAKKILKEAIISDKPLLCWYPLETKIIEISQIGRNHPARL